MPTHKKWCTIEKSSNVKLGLATLFFCTISAAVMFMSTIATRALTEQVYLTSTTCVVQKLELHPDPVPCIVPTCGNFITSVGCRQTGYCLRMTVNLTVEEAHIKELAQMNLLGQGVSTEQTSEIPMLELATLYQYKRAHSIPCTGLEGGVEGDRVCRPTKLYDTSLYRPSKDVKPTIETEAADGRILELVDPTDSGRCFALTCREEGAVAKREALELMSYWPNGSTLQSCHYLRSYDEVDREINQGRVPVVIAKEFTGGYGPMMVVAYTAASVVMWLGACQLCLFRLQFHHELAERATAHDFIHGVAGTKSKKTLARLRAT